MDIRNLSLKIKSCIACNQDGCPEFKERLNQHVLSHHSNSKPSLSNPHVSEGKSSGTFTTPMTSRTPSIEAINSDEQTSTVDLAIEELKPLRQPTYREALEGEIFIWAEDLPKYPNPSAENLKQNILNELIEKVDSLKPEVNEDYYQIKLSNEVSKFLESLPPNSYVKKRDPSLDSLKLKLIHKIYELNKKMINRTRNTNNFGRYSENQKIPVVRDSLTNTTLLNNNDYRRENKTSYDSYLRNNQTRTIGTNTSLHAFNDRYITFHRPEFQHQNSDDTKLVDAEVQKSFHSMQPCYGQIYGQPNLKINKQHKKEINEDVCKEKISTWLMQVIQKSQRNVEQNDKKILTDVLFNRLKPLLIIKMDSQKYKLLLKVEILNFLYDYFMVVVVTNGKYFDKLTDNLAIALLAEKANSEVPYSGSNTKYTYSCVDQKISHNADTESYFKSIFYKIVTDALENVTINSENVENDITEILLHNIDQLRSGFHEDIKDDIQVLLKSTTDLYDVTISDIVNVVMDQLSYFLCDSVDYCNSIQKVKMPLWSHNLSVYKSELALRNPHKKSKTSLLRFSDPVKRSEPKLNTEERAYKERIYSLMSAWVKTLPEKRNKAEDIIIKETIINNLSIDIMDQVKLEAVSPETRSEKEKYLSFFIYRWLNRFEYFDEISNAQPYVDKLIKKIINIPLPTHGSQQIKKINKFMRMTSCSQAVLMPEDVLEDEIAIIINAQPSKIFINADKETRNQRVHEFALSIQNNLEDASKDITKEIIEWLTKIIKPEEIQKLNSLKEQLTKRINSLLRERTSNDHHQDGLPCATIDVENEKVTSVCCELNANNSQDPENAFKEFIAKYIEHYCDVENSIAREAFGEILKIELHKLRALTSQVRYDNSTENEPHIISPPDSLSRELKYINIISDWLKTLPLPTTFNRTGNSRPRSKFVNCLAKNLSNVDDSRIIHLNGMDYRVYLVSIINKYADQLPIPTHHKINLTGMVYDLAQKIEEVRSRPCCQIANCKSSILYSINSVNNPDEQLFCFIEKYIRENHKELSGDELKLDALSTRLFKEINKMRREIPASSNADDVEERHEAIRRLCFELPYAKEITDCLNNLSLLPIMNKTSRNLIVKMISKLAEKMYERLRALHDDPNVTYFNTILSEYLMRWISEFPLDTSKEIDESIVIQHLLNRMELVNKQKLERQEISQANHESNSREMCKFPNTCCNKTNNSQSNQDPGAAIVEAIENWCAALPVQTDDETNNNTIKEFVATNLFKKISELNMNPKCFTDNNLYREWLSEEIDKQLGNLPYNSKLQTVKEDLKQLLVSKIMEKRIEIREQASGTEYKQELEKTIEMSLPNPVQTYQEESPGFKMYKDRLATMFILDNFDHGYDEVKENYEKRIKKEIDKYFQEAQKRNAIPLNKDQIYNELYSQLFNVPLPNNLSIAEEVEEIKTRCEIDAWFDTLPLRTASCDGEVSARDQIVAMLAKRIHRMEKYEQNPDSKIHKEIAKWLLKLPLLPGHEDKIDELADKLLQRLKSTLRNRKCTQRNESVYIDRFIVDKNKRKGKGVLGTSQIAGPSSENKLWPCPASPTCCQISPPKPTKPADMLMNIVEIWCDQLPLQAKTPQDTDNTKVFKDNLINKVIMKISELNVNPETLNNDFLYDALLDDDLENLLSTLPTSDEFNQSKDLRKKQLKDAIKSVKPLIQKEKAKYEYKQDLQNIVDKFLKEPQNLMPEIRALYVSLKEDIIDNFILYNYHKNYEEGSVYKIMVNIAVEKYFTEVCQNDDNLYNPLMIGNHLLCEMAKVPAPSKTTFLEEIREIRIKSLITEFFNDHSLCNRNGKLLMRNQIIATWAKRLSELEKVSNTTENFNKIKNIVIKCLKKLDANVEEKEINSIVQSLQNLPETEKAGSSESRYEKPPPFTNDEHRYNQNVHAPAQHQTNEYDNKNTERGQSLLSVMPKDHDASNMTQDITNLRDTQRSQFSGRGADNSISESKPNYSDFKREVVLSSSVRDQESNDEKTTLEPNQKTGYKSTSMDKSDVANKPTAPGQVRKSFTPNLQDHPKLFSKPPQQDSTFEHDTNMHQSNSTGPAYKAANDQQNIPPPFIFNSPIRPPHVQQNRSGQRQDSSSIRNNRITQLPSFKSNKSLQNKKLRQPIEKKTIHKVSQQVPQRGTQKAPTLSQSSANSRTYSFDGSMDTDLKSSSKIETTKYNKNKVSTRSSSLHDEERDRFPISSLTTIPKSSNQLRSMREPNSFSIPSQSSSSTPPFTPRRPLSDLNLPCRKRKPSFFFFNPSDVISESSSPGLAGCISPAQYTQTVEKKCRKKENLTSDKEDGNTECQCGKGRKRFCRSEILVCRAHKKKRCKICNGLRPFCYKLPPCQYPGFYYY